MGFWSGSWMVTVCLWIVNSMAILWGEKRSEKTRVKSQIRPGTSMWRFTAATITERGQGDGRMGDKRRLFFLFFFLSKPLPKSNNGLGAGGKRARERPTADNDNKIDSFVVTGYLSIPPVFETIPRSLALFVSVVIALVKRVAKERDS